MNIQRHGCGAGELERRELLKAAGVGFASLSLPFRLERFRQESAPNTLVLIYLRGGADALNIVVPYADERYYELRPTLAVPPEPTETSAGVIRLDDEFGLHPELAPLKPFWDGGQLAPILNVGSPHPTRSHFDAQDFMDYAAPGLRTVHDGWLNRFLAQSREQDADAEGAVRLRALAMQGLLPRSLRGSHSVLAVPERDVLNDPDLLDLFEPFYGELGGGEMQERPEDADPVLRTGRDTIETLRRFREIVGKASPSGRTGRGGRGAGNLIASKLDAISEVIRAGEDLEVAAFDVGGWDTHANQGRTDGSMSLLLRALGGALASFMTNLGPRAKTTLVLTVTEFGRTCRENGNYGTDHGHGGLMLLLGGSVRGGRIHGDWTGLEEKRMYQSRDLEVTTDFRDVFATVLREHLRFDVPKDFFPGYATKPVKKLFA